MNHKRGISAIVATVLIILITVAAVTIIWAAIIPMINSQLSKGTICLDAVSQVSLSDVGYTCKDASDSNVSLQVRHGALDFDLADVQVVVSAGGDSYSYFLSNDSTTLVPAGANIKLPASNEERVYVIDTSNIAAEGKEITSVDIAPVVQVGNSQETCDISASRTLQVCN